MIYTADFGPDWATAAAGVTEYSAAGAVTVARATAGVTHIANGLFARDFTPNGATAILVWDANGVYASEPVAASIPTAAANASAVRTELGVELARVDAAVSSRLATAGYTAPDNAGIAALPTLAGIEASTVLAKSAAVAAIPTTPLLAASYTAPDNAGITAIKAKTDLIPATPAQAGEYSAAIAAIPTTPLLSADARLNNLDAAVSSRLSTAGYTAPSNATIAAIDARLPSDPADQSLVISAIEAIPAAPTASATASAVRVEIATELGRIDATVTSRQATSDADTKQAAVLSAIDAVPTAVENATTLLGTTL